MITALACAAVLVHTTPLPHSGTASQRTVATRGFRGTLVVEAFES